MTSGRRSRSRSEGGSNVPDWVWGAGLGLIVLVFIVGFFVFSQVGSGSGNFCDKAQTPLGDPSDVSEAGFATEDNSLGHMITLLNQGDFNAATTIFYGPVHNFTHNVDPQVRAVNKSLAVNLCNAVTTLEVDLTVSQSGATIEKLAADTTAVRNYLRDSGEALGFARASG